MSVGSTFRKDSFRQIKIRLHRGFSFWIQMFNLIIYLQVQYNFTLMRLLGHLIVHWWIWCCYYFLLLCIWLFWLFLCPFQMCVKAAFLFWWIVFLLFVLMVVHIIIWSLSSHVIVGDVCSLYQYDANVFHHGDLEGDNIIHLENKSMLLMIAIAMINRK